MGRTPPINRRIFKTPHAGKPFVYADDNEPTIGSIRDRARWLRKHATPAEGLLWASLRKLRNRGFHFRRQAPIGDYIADFVCHTAKIIVEVDGSQHGTNNAVAYDDRRTKFLNTRGYTVLRFWNEEVMRNSGSVVDQILRATAPTRKGEVNMTVETVTSEGACRRSAPLLQEATMRTKHQDFSF